MTESRKNVVADDPVIKRVVAEMKVLPGVVAIGLGGSRSIGTATAHSDYDIILFSEKPDGIDADAIQAVLERFGGGWQGGEAKPFAEMTVEGKKVEVLFRSFQRIESEIAMAKKGEFRRVLNPLHVIGFLSTIVVSYATYIRPLWDPEGRLREVVKSAFPYPEALREKMIQTFRTEAKVALIHAGKTRSVHDIAHLMGLYSRAHVAWVILLFAINRRYPIIDKGGRQLVPKMPASPANFDFRTKAIFRAAAAGDLKGALSEANRLHNEIARLSYDKPEASAQPAPEATAAEQA